MRISDPDQDGGPDQRLDPDQLGAQYLLRQRALKISRYHRLLACVAPEPEHFPTLVIPGDARIEPESAIPGLVQRTIPE